MLATVANSLVVAVTLAQADPPASTSAAASSEASSTELQEVIVTANRQQSNAQSVPISMTAISGSELQQEGANSLTSLNQLAPSLYVLEGIGAGTPRFSIRGISNTDITPISSTPVALYVDDVYQASNYGVSSQLFDVQRIEVLRGPQGTLFGKNTTGGAIEYFSQVPTNKFEGYVSVDGEGGDEAGGWVEAVLNVPLIDQVLATRLSFQGNTEGDYIKDVNLGLDYGVSHSYSGRWQLRWTPDELTSANLTVFASKRFGDGPIYHGQYSTTPCAGFIALYLCPNGYPTPAPNSNPDTVALAPGIPDYENWQNQGATLRLERQFNGFGLTSISAYRDGRYDTYQDETGFPNDFFDLLQELRTRQASQELRLATDQTKRLSGVVGAFWEHDVTSFDSAYAATSAPPGLDSNVPSYGEAKTTSYAAFGNVTFKVLDDLSLIGGIRKSVEEKSYYSWAEYFDYSGYPWTPGQLLEPISAPPPVAPDIPPISGLQYGSWHPVTWDGTIDYQTTSDVLLFGRVSEGFRSGGFNGVQLTTPTVPNPQLPPIYNPEQLRAYEVGIKSDFFEHRLEINATGFHYDYTNVQVITLQAAIAITANAARAKDDGAELEIAARPLSALELKLSAGYADAHFTEYSSGGVSYVGNPLPNSPKTTVNASVAYTLPVGRSYDLTAMTWWSYRGQIYFDQTADPNIGSGPLTTGNVRFNLDPHDQGVWYSLYVKNLTNQKPVTYAFSFYPYFYSQLFGVGRIFGGEVGYRW